MQTEVAPAKVRLSDELGQLPPTRYVLGKEGDGYSEDRLLDEPAWAEENMRAYAAEQLAAERERCAKIAEKYGRSDLSTGRQIADEIRSSSDTSESGLT